MKISFFGGSFNPPTYAHLNIAVDSLRKLNVDKLFFVPVGNTYKKPYLIDEKYRYEMLEIMCNNEKIGMSCMICRQVISEFFDKDAKIIAMNPYGEEIIHTVEELCPYPFSDEDLK